MGTAPAPGRCRQLVATSLPSSQHEQICRSLAEHAVPQHLEVHARGDAALCLMLWPRTWQRRTWRAPRRHEPVLITRAHVCGVIRARPIAAVLMLGGCYSALSVCMV